jgi:hypothetical protein
MKMEKTKILIVTTAIAAIIVVTLAGAAYAQTLNQQNYAAYPSGYSQLQQTQGLAGPTRAYEYGGYSCPRNGGANTYGSPQSEYSHGMGMLGGMTGRYYR